MKRTVIILILLLPGLFAAAQAVFKTIAPRQYVVEGESFRIQFVAQDVESMGNFTAPTFRGFRVVNGPEIYSGKTTSFLGQPKQLKNTTYTLQAVKPGLYIIPGATATINGRNYSSNDVWIKVISREEADMRNRNDEPGDNSAYLLRPGEDPYEKIRQNLFVKVMVNKKNCFPGEPVVATIKLYSRLESKSDIVKNPGLYGFTVYDMVNLDDKVMSVETVNGRMFDVHTIRKVQLYPLQPGTFTIDPMQIKNKVEFSRSGVSRKTEQEIVEGVFEEAETAPAAGTEVFETDISTAPITINVKPMPARNKPADFNGATGRFTMTAALEKDELAKNEEGYLVVTVKGKGNFTQLTPPIVEWPSGIEGFDPTVTESLDKMAVPLAGVKTYRYAFVSSKPGTYELPATSFSFFDPDTNSYKTVKTDSKRVAVNTTEKINNAAVVKKNPTLDFDNKTSWVAAGIVVLLGLTAVIYWLTRKKEVIPQKIPVIEKTITVVSIDDLLKPAYLMIPAADKDFYSILHKTIWSHLATQFNLSGSDLNKQAITQHISQLKDGTTTSNDLLAILGQCEAGMYTDADMGENKEELLIRLKTVLEKINHNHPDFF